MLSKWKWKRRCQNEQNNMQRVKNFKVEDNEFQSNEAFTQLIESQCYWGIINRLFNLLIYCLKECFKIIIKESKYLITV